MHYRYLELSVCHIDPYSENCVRAWESHRITWYASALFYK